LMYTFDPWLGLALGILTAIVGLIAALKASARSPTHRSQRRRNSSARGKGCLTFSTNSLSVIGYGPPDKDTRLAALPQIVAKNPENGFRNTLAARGKSGIRRQFRKFGNSGDGERSTISAKRSTISSAQQYPPAIHKSRSTISNAL